MPKLNKEMLTNKNTYFDNGFPEGEQLPRSFQVSFEQVSNDEPAVRITIDGKQVGDVITDNSYRDDLYRFHDIFHFSYVAVLGWSPCVRNMLRRKRKSDSKIDQVEDGARAIITEEAISLLVFSFAREQRLLVDSEVDPIVLSTIERMTKGLEVSRRSLDDWRTAILQGYAIFRELVRNGGGVVEIDMSGQQIRYLGH